MLSFQHFEPMIQQFAWTLGHFLWQGLAIAALLMLTLKVGRVRRAQVRYVFSVIAFVAMSVTPVITFVLLSHTRPLVNDLSLPVEQSSIVIEPSIIESVESHADDVTVPELAADSPRHPEAWIVASWLVGVSLFSTRLLCGWIGVLRLKRRARQAPMWLEEHGRQLARLMSLTCPPIRLSPTVPDAIAVGFWKPMILLPVAWVSEVPVEMLEAIVAHELAHIRRRDLWVNLFQRIVESLFFYHPAVWWLSHRIRIERELCSDELAVKVLQSPVQYAETLEYVGRLSHATHPSSLAVSIGGAKSILLSRVINILRRQEGSSLDWAAGAIPLVAVAFVWCAISAFQTKPALAKEPVEQAVSLDTPADATKPVNEKVTELPEWWDETPESFPPKIQLKPAPPDPWADWKDDTVQYNAEVAAMVNGKPLLKGEVLDRYSGYLLQMRQGLQKKITPADYVKVRDMFVQRDLSSHVQRRVVIDRLKSRLTAGKIEALRRHCDELFEREIDKLKRELKAATLEELKTELRRRDSSLVSVKHSFVTERMAMEGVAYMLPKYPPITSEEIEAYYNLHAEELTQVATVTWDEIQVSFENADEKVSALRKILLARQDLRAGVPFATVAEKYSDGRTAKTGGRWEKMEAGTLKDLDFEHAVFDMPLDTLSEIQEGLSQFRLVIVRDRREVGLASLEEATSQIRSRLEQDRSKGSVEKLFREMFAEAVVETKYEWTRPKTDE